MQENYKFCLVNWRDKSTYTDIFLKKDSGRIGKDEMIVNQSRKALVLRLTFVFVEWVLFKIK